jgi:SMODS and SLOG-associating 2TM effector domain family 4
MFQLSLVDHIRLSFGSMVGAYEGHTEAAARLARWAGYAKAGILVLLGLTAAASIASVVRGGVYTMSAAVLSAIAFATGAAFVAIDPETRVYAHRATAARLWLICEKYRALLTEIHDELIDLPAIAQRRDALQKEASELFVQAPPADRATYEIARKTLGAAYSDQQVDQFLPLPLRRAGGATT